MHKICWLSMLMHFGFFVSTSPTCSKSHFPVSLLFSGNEQNNDVKIIVVVLMRRPNLSQWDVWFFFFWRERTTHLNSNSVTYLLFDLGQFILPLWAFNGNNSNNSSVPLKGYLCDVRHTGTCIHTCKCRCTVPGRLSIAFPDSFTKLPSK